LQVIFRALDVAPEGSSQSLTIRVYALEFKNSLTDSSWTALPLIAGNGGLLRLTDSSASAGQRFYRVRQW